MRIDQAGPRTWLLAAVALWAVVTWVLAAAGLGGRVEALPEDPALLQPLPQGGGAGGERLGPPGQYPAIVERALFAPDRRHRPFLLDPGEGVEGGAPDGFDVVLTSVLITPGLEMAIVQREDGEAVSFRVGETARQAPGWRLVSVQPRAATFAGPEGERVLELRVYDGVGGQPPTPVTGTDGGADARAVADDDGAPRRRAADDASSDTIRESAPAAEEVTPAQQAEAIRRRIEERRARLREQRQQAPAAAQENP
ncbi:MAG: general secretion pathway protein GspN [Gammaproteobacteria bacterium]|nr:general secretion pathway protein GspN [Gammaproteobacteria bacterium]